MVLDDTIDYIAVYKGSTTDAEGVALVTLKAGQSRTFTVPPGSYRVFITTYWYDTGQKRTKSYLTNVFSAPAGLTKTVTYTGTDLTVN
jgi:hypothetical protein